MITLRQNKRLAAIILSVAGLLLIPLIVRQFTNEVNLDRTDFIVMAALQLSTGLLYRLCSGFACFSSNMGRTCGRYLRASLAGH
jgi:hypothetical protein